MACVELITSGIAKDCDTINAAIGSESDLILVNYVDFDKDLTLATREGDNTNGNDGGLTAIRLKIGATQYTFAGTEYSIVPNVATEIREDGDAWYIHNLQFTVYSKLAKDRKVLENLGGSRVVAIVIDRSTGLYEIFGIDHGLKVGNIERVYTGAQNSNFYTVSLMTPDIAVVRESSLAELAVSIVTAT